MPNFRHRLNRAQQRVYDRSDAVSAVPLRASPRLMRAVHALPTALESAGAAQVQRLAQAIADEITSGLGVSRVRVQVEAVRPHDRRGELHGLYTARGRGSETIRVWMLTAKRGQVVRFKTFLRTLLHELCHHLDFTLLGLPASFHTDGFYKRESSLFYQIGGAVAAPGGRDASGGRRPAPGGTPRSHTDDVAVS